MKSTQQQQPPLQAEGQILNPPTDEEIRQFIQGGNSIGSFQSKKSPDVSLNLHENLLLDVLGHFFGPILLL